MKALSNSKDCPKCGSNHKSSPFCIYADGYHCFSCGHSKRGDRSYSVREQLTIEAPEYPDDIIQQPSEFGVQNLKWLYERGLTDNDIQEFRIGEDQHGWLIMPCIIDNVLVHYQRRRIEEREIQTFGEKHPLLTESVNKNVLVVCEDLISHIRIVKNGYTSLCLFGTKMAYDDVKRFSTYRNILVWLDNDYTKETNSGQIAAEKICKSFDNVLSYKYRQRSFSTKDYIIKNIVTDKEPKEMLNSEIKKTLGAVYEHTFPEE